MGLFSSIGGAVGSAFGPVGSGVGYAGGSIADYYMDKHEASKAYKTQRKDAIQFWNMQNEYNDPSAQMARLHAAGLNPMLVYTGGNVTGNSSSSISGPSYDTSSYSSGKYGSDTDKFTRMNLRQQMQNTTDSGSLDNQLKQVQLEKARWELDNLKAGRNTNGFINQSSNVKPFHYIENVTTAEEVINNPDLSPTEKRFYLSLIDKNDSPLGHSINGEAGNFIYRLFRGGKTNYNDRIKKNYSNYKPVVINGRLITGELF